MNVESVMTPDPKTCTTQDNLNRAANLMWEGDCGSIPVVDETGRLCGVLTDRDLCMASYTQGKPLHEIQVAAAMSKTLFTLAPNASIEDALALFTERKVRRAPVVNQIGVVIGILSIADIVHADATGKLKKHVKPESVLAAVHAVSKPRHEKSAVQLALRDVIVAPASKRATPAPKSTRKKSRTR